MKEIRLLKADEIEAKVNMVSAKGCQLLLYKTSRVDMAILDEVFGVMNWQSDYKVVKENLYCGIGVYNEVSKEWIWKWDCGIESREADGNEKKGEASDAFKRAGFKWGIGRELYTSPFIWLNIPTKKKDMGSGYELENKYARFNVKEIEYGENREITYLVIVDEKGNVVYQTGKQIAPQKSRSEKIADTKEKNKEDLERRFEACEQYVYSGKPWTYTFEEHYVALMRSACKNIPKERVEKLMSAYEKMEKDALPNY